jgi:serine/threonine protein kinase
MHHRKRNADTSLEDLQLTAPNPPNERQQWAEGLNRHGDSIAGAREIERILQLSENNFIRLLQLVRTLLNNKMLDKSSFLEALNAVSIKLPDVTRSAHTKTKHAIDGWNKITLDSRVTFFLQKGASRKRLAPGYQCVNGGYESPQSLSPRWAVKWVWINPDDAAASLKAARHEVRHLRNAGINTFFYATKRSIKIVMDWQRGETLEALVLSNRIDDYSFTTRLKWCASILSHLVKAYDKFIVHGDLNRGNVIINLDSDEAVLIDYELSRKMLTGFECSYAYDGHYFANTYVKLGLFKSFYSSEHGTSLQRSIIHELVSALTHYGEECSVKQAHEYCIQVLANIDKMTEEKLQEIINTTIKRYTLTVDEVLHGIKRR